MKPTLEDFENRPKFGEIFGVTLSGQKLHLKHLPTI